MTWLLLLLTSSGFAADIERTMRIAPADARGLRFSVKNRPATLELGFRMQPGGAPVRLVVIPEADENRFKAGRSHTVIAATGFERSAKLKAYVATPGDYVVMVDNRPELRAAATVELSGAIEYDMTPRDAKELSPVRRWTVIALSLITFFAISIVAGRRLWKATADRRLERDDLFS
jgi:hypothetical protein